MKVHKYSKYKYSIAELNTSLQYFFVTLQTRNFSPTHLIAHDCPL